MYIYLTANFQNTSVIGPIVPLCFVIVPGVYIAVNSEELLYENNPILFNLVFGLIGSKITNKLIVSVNIAVHTQNILMVVLLYRWLK